MKSINWEQVKKVQKELNFSGVVYAAQDEEMQVKSYGYANRAEETENHDDTKFAIASGAKIFTSVAICKLVQEDKIAFDSKLTDILKIPLPNFDKNITVHHLLTHTSGVPDYFNEDEMDDFEALWESVPMYRVRKPIDFLPLFQHEAMTGPVGLDFAYNNTGYILLGMVIEEVTRENFADYIESNIMAPIGMTDSGYYEVDQLPGNTALGYIDFPDGSWKTNLFALPAKGGPDGGVYVTVRDMGIFWDALENSELLTPDMTHELLEPRELVDDDIYYGYGGYMEVNEAGVVKLIQMGYDPGVNYRAVYYPETALTIVVCSNVEDGAYEMLKEIEDMAAMAN